MPARMLVLIFVAVLTTASAAHAQDALVISVWGGNWKDTVERVIGKAFTAKTGTPVEFEVGGTIDRLAKARVAKGNPLVDLNFTTTHVARLYISDGLYAPLDMSKISNAKEIAREAIRSEYHLGSWSYVYTIAYRPDLVKEEITRWSDLWKPSLKGKIAMPDFDPSHIITIAALMEGGNEVNSTLTACVPHCAGVDRVTCARSGKTTTRATWDARRSAITGAPCSPWAA